MQRAESVAGIVWLASYPKSGNTWLRALLTNYLRDAAEPADINTLIGAPGAASRKLFDEQAGAKSSNFTSAEIEAARPRVYESLARQSGGPVFLKIHDACTLTPDGEPLIGRTSTRGVLYIVRHPADVVVSYAHHRGCTMEDAIAFLANSEHRLASHANGVESQLPQRLLSWSEHVTSWLDSGLPVHVIRYEDLHAHPEASLERVIDFLGEPRDRSRIERAVTFSSFAELSRQERAHGFNERPSSSRPFFRAGNPGAAHTLTAAQLARIGERHEPVLHRLCYGVRP